MRAWRLAWAAPLLCLAAAAAAQTAAVRLKDLGRVEGPQDNALIGYGLVTGLAGTGDSPRSRATRQSIANLMSQFGMNIPNDQVQSRNVAAVMVMATLPALGRAGSRIDITVTSMGDARSLLGGTLLLTPLKGPDGRVHALGQGAVSVGGYRYDSLGNLVQKNHPTVGMVPSGASIELTAGTANVAADGRVVFALNAPDYTTASRVADSINRHFGQTLARPRDAAAIDIVVPVAAGEGAVAFLTRLEGLAVEPDQRARVVINERNGLVVSGGDVRITQATISHGDLKVSVMPDLNPSQPYGGPWADGRTAGGYTPGVPDKRIEVSEAEMQSISLAGNSTVADLVRSLKRIKTSPRDMISILQGMKTAGALHAELIIQ